MLLDTLYTLTYALPHILSHTEVGMCQIHISRYPHMLHHNPPHTLAHRILCLIQNTNTMQDDCSRLSKTGGLLDECNFSK
jgi:hypothetical protein